MGKSRISSRQFSFVGGDHGPWRVTRIETLAGDPLPPVTSIAITTDKEIAVNPSVAWVLRGITSNERYVHRDEKNQLVSRQPNLGRIEATCAALIPIRKGPGWWALAQDERRRIFEDQSKHIRIGLQYLPTVARRLHHCRDISEEEPFDFLTWFEYAPSQEATFDALVTELRASEEWDYVDREIDIRVVRAGT